MKKVILFFALGIFAHTVSFADDNSETTESFSGNKNVCVEQSTEFLMKKFRTPFSVNAYKIYPVGGSKHPMLSDVWMWTSLCSGEIVFHATVRPETCKNAHYGRTPNYIRSVYGTGSCKALFKN